MSSCTISKVDTYECKTIFKNIMRLNPSIDFRKTLYRDVSNTSFLTGEGCQTFFSHVMHGQRAPSFG